MHSVMAVSDFSQPPGASFGRFSSSRPKGVSIGLRMSLAGLCGLVLTIGGSVVFGHLTGSAARHNTSAGPSQGVGAWVLFIVVVTMLALIPLGLLVAIVSGLLSLRSSSPEVEEERRRLALARDTAHTVDEVYAAQAAPIPGRSWRRLLPLAWTAPVLLAYLALNLGHSPGLALALLAVEVPIVVAMTASSRRRSASARADLEAQTGVRRDEHGDEAALAARADSVRAAAAAAGWQFAPAAETLVVGNNGTPLNLCTGSLDGQPFLTFDDLSLVHLDSPVIGASGVTQRTATKIADARTVAQLPFPAVFRMVAAQRGATGAAADIRWSSFGGEISLESADFNARFVVYGDDPIRSRMVLNPAVMNLLLQAPVPVELVVEQGILEVATGHVLLPVGHLPSLARFAVTVGSSARSSMVESLPPS